MVPARLDDGGHLVPAQVCGEGVEGVDEEMKRDKEFENFCEIVSGQGWLYREVTPAALQYWEGLQWARLWARPHPPPSLLLIEGWIVAVGSHEQF